MAVVRVHLQRRLVVGTPQAEGHEPGVQQAGVVRILDVLLHQLPVARDALAVVAEDRELPPIEHPVEVAEHGRTHEVFERLDVVIERREHHAAARGDLQLREAVIGRLEVGRHAALHLALGAHAAAEWHALQVALQRVAPLVIRADEFLARAVALAAELHAAVRADVLEHLHRAGGVAHDDHRALTDHRAFEITRVRQLGFERHVAPVGAVEEALELLAVHLVVRVDAERDAARAVALPCDRRGGHRGRSNCHRTLASLLMTRDDTAEPTGPDRASRLCAR